MVPATKIEINHLFLFIGSKISAIFFLTVFATLVIISA
jgi:hypothetical protein